MSNLSITRRSTWLSFALLLGLATFAGAQLAQPKPSPVNLAPPPVMEFTQQEVQPDALVQTLNDLSKQHWDVFQIVPAWSFKNQNGEAELVPRAYEVFGRRPAPQK
jgi:hypothetical protein